jgi:hypothetical protein
MLLPYIIKHAYATYNYSGAKERNYTPKKPSYPEVRKQLPAEQVKSVTIKEKSNPQLPKNGSNKPADKWYSEFEFLHSFAPTMSGTGSGHQYWQDKRNPFEV